MEDMNIQFIVSPLDIKHRDGTAVDNKLLIYIRNLFIIDIKQVFGLVEGHTVQVIQEDDVQTRNIITTQDYWDLEPGITIKEDSKRSNQALMYDWIKADLLVDLIFIEFDLLSKKVFYAWLFTDSFPLSTGSIEFDKLTEKDLFNQKDKPIDIEYDITFKGHHQSYPRAMKIAQDLMENTTTI